MALPIGCGHSVGIASVEPQVIESCAKLCWLTTVMKPVIDSNYTLKKPYKRNHTKIGLTDLYRGITHRYRQIFTPQPYLEQIMVLFKLIF